VIVAWHEVPGKASSQESRPVGYGLIPAGERTDLSRRDGAIVAWHEVPGKASSQESRPVGYGLIPAGERTDSNDWRIGVTKFRHTKL
jgi:hypothetical protein